MALMITPIILSGGAGTRLWPLSTPERPKQLLALVGDRTMLQMTAARAADQQLFGPAIIVANAQHAEEIERQLREIGAKVASIILEPAGRNTAPAIALAALLAPSDAPMLVMPSDHLISDTAAFAAPSRLHCRSRSRVGSSPSESSPTGGDRLWLYPPGR
jgi:mannose-1-phosphate guanylyltransferase/mannose-1-phosphate guanylyltransferase/mannose-6-phosphate isomerase